MIIQNAATCNMDEIIVEDVTTGSVNRYKKVNEND